MKETMYAILAFLFMFVLAVEPLTSTSDAAAYPADASQVSFEPTATPDVSGTVLDSSDWSSYQWAASFFVVFFVILCLILLGIFVLSMLG